MAKLETPLLFTGSLGGLSAYSMRGVDKIIVRRKGGASKDKIRTHPNFDFTRRINAEFGGRAQCSKFVMLALQHVKPLGDYNIAGPLNSILTRIQKLDEINVVGKRDIAMSKNPKLLEGFSLNRQMSFDSVVRNTLVCTVSRESCSAEVEIPALVQGINLFTPKSHPYYSFVLTLGIVPDILFAGDAYAPSSGSDNFSPAQRETTTWYTREGSPLTTLRVTLPEATPNPTCTLMVAVGIRYGSPAGEEISQVRHAGSAKVLVVT